MQDILLGAYNIKFLRTSVYFRVCLPAVFVTYSLILPPLRQISSLTGLTFLDFVTHIVLRAEMVVSRLTPAWRTRGYNLSMFYLLSCVLTLPIAYASVSIAIQVIRETRFLHQIEGRSPGKGKNFLFIIKFECSVLILVPVLHLPAYINFPTWFTILH
jgi:hypothetical protein